MAGPIGSDSEQISEINIVPFVDIILVVLIIFMVTAPLIIQPSIKVDLPKSATGTKTAPSPLNITVNRAGVVRINNKKVSIRRITPTIRSLRKKNPQLKAVISADKATALQKVITVIDRVKMAGVTRFAISTSKK